jgi:hypothetical protein
MTPETEQKPVVYATSLKTAKEGEVLLLKSRDSSSVAIIERTTQTMIVAKGRRFNREGREKGERGFGWHYTYLKITTPEEALEVRNENERRNKINRLTEFKWKDLTLDQLRQVSALLESFKAEVTPVDL